MSIQSLIIHFLLMCAAISSAHCLEFVVTPTNQTVAPNANASFHCAVNGSGVYVNWMVDSRTYSRMEVMPRGYSSTWDNNVNNMISTTLIIDSRHIKNGTSIRCNAGNSKTRSFSDKAHLNIAAEPMIPVGLNVEYDRTTTAVNVKWREPFTYLPQFPIINYMAEIEYLTPEHNLFQTDNLVIKGSETSLSLDLNETELCISNQVCITLRAVNSIGYSRETETTCTNIERDHTPLPVNASVSKHQDGMTLVSVLYQVPLCFPQVVQSLLLVEEAATYSVNELTSQLQPSQEGVVLMEAHTLTQMKQDVVYSVVVQLTSVAGNTTSLPVYVTLPPQATTGSDDSGGGAIAGIVAAVLLSLFLVVALVVAFMIFVYFRSRSKDVMVINQNMQPNPLYENTFYDYIPEGLTSNPVRSHSYDSHIYQDMPDIVRRQNNNGYITPAFRSLPINTGHSCLDMESPSLEEMKRVQTVVAEAVGGSERTILSPQQIVPEEETGTERESEYITMHSVTEQPAPALQTDV